jgi:ABC-type phosphate transport system ATPase subunit
MVMNRKHQKTLEAVFKNSVSGTLIWDDIERLFTALGGQVSEGQGSRVRVALNGVRQVFHRPHPQKETKKGAVKSVRDFLERAGVKHNA